MNTVWDPLRKKNVALTPEEDVRQWFITRLNRSLGVPMHMMMSEAGFRLGEKQFRADILIFGRDARPLAVVECKRPEVTLDSKVLDQAIRYNMVLNVRYLFITNGHKTFICRKDEEGSGPAFRFISEAPTYEEMLASGKKD